MWGMVGSPLSAVEMSQSSNLERYFNYTERSVTGCIGMCGVGSPMEGQKGLTLLSQCSSSGCPECGVLS